MNEESFLIKAAGFSMWPFVKDGDRLIVKKLKVQDLKIGDIILYKDGNNSQNICHRFVKKIESKDGFMLFARADAGGILSGPISEDNLIGRVIGIIRDGKVMNLRTRQQIVLNWFNVKFYIFFRVVFIFFRRMMVYLPR